MQEAYPQVVTSGLCHSVQGSARMLARWIGAPQEEITYLCAGINHLAFYLEYKWNGKDAYPLIRKAITENPAVYNAEQVRNEMYLAFDYYVTESSGHNSEYNPWFRKRPDLIEKYCTHGTGWNPGLYALILQDYEKADEEWRSDFKEFMEKPVNLARGMEYAASILNSSFGDGTLFTHIGMSYFRILIGWAIGCIVAIPLGMLAGRIAFLRALVEPYIDFFRFIPPIAFVTLFLIWFRRRSSTSANPHRIETAAPIRRRLHIFLEMPEQCCGIRRP
jgi:alpha-galactosidase